MNNLFSKITEWGIERNLHTQDPKIQAVKLLEEIGELASGLNRNDLAMIKDSIGDAVVVLTILCSQLNLSIEECIELAYNVIKDRKGKLINGTFVKQEDLHD